MHDDFRSSDQPLEDATGSGTDWDALARYAAGESPAAEAASVEAWLETHPADAALVAFVRSGLEHQVAAPTVDVEMALARVRDRISAESSAPMAEQRNAPARPPLTVSQGGAARSVARRPWSATRRVGLAAAAVMTLTLAFSIARTVTRTTLPDETRTAAASVAAPRVYETRVGQRDSVLLADGSRVILAPGSRLAVGARFDSARTVELDGAAYFDVRHDETHPFTVRSRGAEIRDVGTAFSVSNDGEGSVSVAVTEGVVAMRSMAGAAPVELRAGDRGVMMGAAAMSGHGQSTSGVIRVLPGTVTPDDVAWTRGDLSYRDAPVSLVLADLKRWYGVTLQVTDSSLQRRTLKISFAGSNAAEAVEKVALALGAETVQRGDTVLLRMPAR
jgi:transmembrane sensor